MEGASKLPIIISNRRIEADCQSWGLRRCITPKENELMVKGIGGLSKFFVSLDFLLKRLKKWTNEIRLILIWYKYFIPEKRKYELNDQRMQFKSFLKTFRHLDRANFGSMPSNKLNRWPENDFKIIFCTLLNERLLWAQIKVIERTQVCASIPCRQINDILLKMHSLCKGHWLRPNEAQLHFNNLSKLVQLILNQRIIW